MFQARYFKSVKSCNFDFLNLQGKISFEGVNFSLFFKGTCSAVFAINFWIAL